MSTQLSNYTFSHVLSTWVAFTSGFLLSRDGHIYKLVIVGAPVWGLGDLEDYHITKFRGNAPVCFSIPCTGRGCYFWGATGWCFVRIDGRYRMTMEHIWELEKHTDLLLKKTLQKVAKAGRKHEGKRKSRKDKVSFHTSPDQATPEF